MRTGATQIPVPRHRTVVLPKLSMPSFFWLVGLFEGEGYFYKGRPGERPILRVEMTDQDVIARAAALLATSTVRDQRHRGGRKDTAVARMTGLKAAEMMAMMQPFLSRRRREQIENALDDVGLRGNRRLSDKVVREIRVRCRSNSCAAVGRSFDLHPQVVRDIAQYKTYLPVRFVNRRRPETLAKAFPLFERHWLAGYLEGEGTFGFMKTGRYGHLRVKVSSVDLDPIERVARYWDCNVTSDGVNQAGRQMHCARVTGHQAADCMIDVFPLMGQRRRGRILTSLAEYVRCAEGLRGTKTQVRRRQSETRRYRRFLRARDIASDF